MSSLNADTPAEAYANREERILSEKEKTHDLCRPEREFLIYLRSKRLSIKNILLVNHILVFLLALQTEENRQEEEDKS